MTDPILSNLAARAYGATQSAVNAQPPSGSDSGIVPAPDFGLMMQQVAQSVSQNGQAVESAIGQAAYGRQSDLVDVVTAVAAAEANLEMIIAVRDQFIKAYQEVIRMPI